MANHAEDIKDAITSFDVARISDIENERLPPDLVDAADVEGMEDFGSPVTSPRTSVDYSGMFGSPSHRGSVSSAPTSPQIPETPGRGTPSPLDSPSAEYAPGTPSTPGSGRPNSGDFRKGHGRNSSLGTTMTSPSTRRRSLESTVTMIREAIEKKDQVRCSLLLDSTV